MQIDESAAAHDGAPSVDLGAAKVALRALMSAVRESEGHEGARDPTREPLANDLSLEGPDQALEGLRTNVFLSTTNADSSTLLLSVVLLVGDTPLELFNDALVALNAQSDTNFELLVVSPRSSSHRSGQLAECLATFSELITRARIIESVATAPTASARSEDVLMGLKEAHGRYVTFLEASSVVFGHFVSTFSQLATNSSAALLRARAVHQPLRHVTWPDGSPGFEPTAGAVAASTRNFRALDHLTRNETPTGSYSLLREFFVGDANVDEDQMILEAAVLGGVAEANDDVVVLLRSLPT